MTITIVILVCLTLIIIAAIIGICYMAQDGDLGDFIDKIKEWRMQRLQAKLDAKVKIETEKSKVAIRKAELQNRSAIDNMRDELDK
jgi:hypothetical protein